MKKILLILLTLPLFAFAQEAPPTFKSFIEQQPVKKIKNIQVLKSLPIWSDDFSDASTWSQSNSGTQDVNWSIETDVNAMPDAAGGAIFPFASSTVANGYALINSDGAPGNTDGSGSIVAQLTTANPIDLSANLSVLLEFSHNYRWYQDTRGVRVSGDNGSTWTEYELTNQDGYPNDQNSENPTVEAINISAVAGGQSQVLIQFYYNDNDIWSWYWAVDDVRITSQPATDIALTHVSMSTLEGYEYGRIPSAHIKDSLVIGAEVFNLGINTQTNIEVAMNISNTSGTSVFSESAIITSLDSDSTVFTQTIFTNISLEVGVSEFSTVVSSDGDNVNGANFDNNTYTKNFEVTENLFSIDGIGVYDNDILSTSSIGTNWGNGTIIMARYELLVATDVVGLQLALTPFTDVGGQVFPFLVTEETIGTDDMSSSNRIAENVDGVMITQGHINNGLMFVDLVPTTLDAGVYYACVELYNGVHILDDETVVQPFNASMFHYIDDGNNYTNGNAAAIRLAINDYVGCTSSLADNYNPQSTIDNGSCELSACPYSMFLEYNSNYTIADASLCLTVIVEGCINSSAVNFNSEATIDDGTCIIYGCMDLNSDNYNPEATLQDESCILYGCTNETAENYNDQATENDGSCIIYGCTISMFPNFNPEATIDNVSCSFDGFGVYGCTNINALNYDSQANIDNGSCTYEETNEDCTYCIQEEQIPIYLPQGWSIFGFTCIEPIDAASAFSPIIDSVVIVKDGDGNTYLPDWNFNGIGDLLYSKGYQIKTTDEILDFSFCPTIIISE